MISGKETRNPFVDIITNETKLKLKNGEDWYDLIINKVDEDSSKKIYSYNAVDQHITELSKNGFNLVLDQTLFNNSGSLPELAQTILQDTDWEVDLSNSNICYQTVEESLIKLKVKDNASVTGLYRINDPDENTVYGDEGSSILTNSNMPSITGKEIYAFYSSCRGKPHRF